MRLIMQICHGCKEGVHADLDEEKSDLNLNMTTKPCISVLQPRIFGLESMLKFLRFVVGSQVQGMSDAPDSSQVGHVLAKL